MIARLIGVKMGLPQVIAIQRHQPHSKIPIIAIIVQRIAARWYSHLHIASIAGIFFPSIRRRQDNPDLIDALTMVDSRFRPTTAPIY